MVVYACTRSSPVVSIKSYGAHGDGVSDDTAAMEKAIASVTRAGGGTVLLPQGTYNVRDVVIPNSVAIRGQGIARSWLRGRVQVGSDVTISEVTLGIADAAVQFVDGASHSRLVHVRFAGGAVGDSARIFLGQGRHTSFIAFSDCVLESGPGNGITINDSGGNIHDIRFDSCIVKPQGRMGFECTSRGSSTAVYQNIALIDCTFEPQGSEAVSFDGPNGVAANCTLDGVLIKGAGNDPSEPFGSGLEINGPTAFSVRQTTIFRCRDSMVNLNGFSPQSSWTFSDCTFDASRTYQTVPMGADSRVINASGMNGAIWDHDVINAGDVAYNCAWLNDSSHNDFSTSTFLGSNQNAGVSQVGGSAGNLTP